MSGAAVLCAAATLHYRLSAAHSAGNGPRVLSSITVSLHSLVPGPVILDDGVERSAESCCYGRNWIDMETVLCKLGRTG